MTLKQRHDDINFSLRTGGEAVLDDPQVLSYLSEALQYKPDADHEARRAALLEALSVNLAQHAWIEVDQSLLPKHLCLLIHLSHAPSGETPTVPAHLDELLFAVARTAGTTEFSPSISIIDNSGNLHCAKAFNSGTYTHIPLDPPHKKRAVQALSLQGVVDHIDATTRGRVRVRG